MYEVESILHVQNELGEGPQWHVGEQALYWVDIMVGNLHRFHPESGKHEVYETGLPVGAAVFRASGGFVLATKRGFAFWNPTDGKLEFIADPEADNPESRFNDGKVDRNGRFWAGTMSDYPRHNLYRLDPDLSVHTMETGITVSNGIGWSPDNRTMYYTDSPKRFIYAYDFDASSGEIANRRIFAQVPEEDGVPDGLTVDADGFVWSARWGGWKIVRHDPDGRVEREIAMPVEYPTSCIFGGPNLDELYITSARTDIPIAERPTQPLAGNIFRLKTDVKGFAETAFSG